MARFDKLEFDDFEHEPQAAVDPPPRVEKDEHYWYKLADSHRRDGNYENALRFYSRALENEKSLINAWVGQVQMLVLIGEYPQASLWSKKALELFPSHADLLAARAQAECRSGNQREAAALSDSALNQRGESAYQWQVRGELMVVTKQKSDRHCFDKAQLASSDYIVPLETGLIYIHHRNFVKAQQRLQTVLEKKSDCVYAWYLYGLCQHKSGFEEAATRSYERCLELRPHHHDAGMRLAELRDGRWNLSRTLRRIIKRKS